MKSITPSIYVENCKEALEFYKDVFGGELKNIQLADNVEMFKGYEGKIIHSELHVNETCVLYFVDLFDEKKDNSGIQLVVELDSEEEINSVYSALIKNGTVVFGLQKTFWGAFHAVVIDCYGITWGLNYTLK
jgi:PhnB protein